jgi:hypothetical protein
MFINGNQTGSASHTSAVSFSGAFVGSQTASGGYLNGYIDDLRISKGVGRYTYSFTPPTAEFPNIGGTVTLTADPYYDYTTLLLPGNGTNGAQNNTFLDSSTNNFTITRNGNTTQGTFSPFSQTGWSNYFDGTTDYLSTPSNAAFGMGTGDFTLEAWVYFTAAQAEKHIIDNGTSGGIFLKTQATTVGIGRAMVAEDTMFSYSFQPNAWYHIAFTRSGSTVYGFVNGSQIGSATNTVNYATGACYVGAASDATKSVNGYISNLRIVKGTAVYTSAFTVPTAPLTAITNTSLLTCQSNRFVDNSSNAFAITRNGDVSVQAFSPFNPTAAWSAATYGGSGYYDGSGDYLNTTTNISAIGTGDFTLEVWCYPTASTSYRYFLAIGPDTNFATGLNTGGYAPYLYAGSFILTSSISTVPNAWNHVQYVRSSGTLTVYVNGVSGGSVTWTGSIAAGKGYIGANDSNLYYFFGYHSSLRFSNIARSVSVPTAPYTSDANTQLLTNFTNAGIFDNAAVADYETVGNAQINTSVKKYGTGSMAFDGSGDYLKTPVTTNLDFGTGDFTIEMWVYFNNTTDSGGLGVGLITNPTGTYSTIYSSSNNGTTLTFYNGSGIVSGTISLSNWIHVAVSRSAGVVKMFINGNQTGSASHTSAVSFSGAFVGSQTASGGYLNGYIDDLRISKGVGRYTYNFTPPTAEFPNIGGTVTLIADPYFDYTTLLLPGNGTNGAQNNTFLDSSTNNFTITRNGNTTQGTFSPFSQTGWGNYFDGTGDTLTVASNAAFGFGTGDFTVELWVYCAFNSAIQEFIDARTADTAQAWVLGITGTGVARTYDGSTVRTGGQLTANFWNHVAWVRASNVNTIYVNGVAGHTWTASQDFGSAKPLTIGNNVGPTNEPFTGYMSNFRIVKGTAVYTANFTPSTTPLTAITNTSLLTCQSNRFVDNSSNAFAITRNGDVSVQAFSPFNPTAAWSAATNGGSGYFDGSGDNLITPTNTALDFGSGNFTIDFWIYPTAFTTYQTVVGTRPDANNSTTAYSIGYSNAGTLYMYTNGFVATSAVGVLRLSEWNYVAVTKSGTTVQFYVNGASSGTAGSNSQSFSGYPIRINGNGDGTEQFTGYVSSVRVIKGTAITPTLPTAPLTAITNTQLLLSFTNAGILDATSKNNLETVGNAQISTTQSKFGGSSIAFDGSGDYLRAFSSTLYDFGTGDFTIEFWSYFNNTSDSGGLGVGVITNPTGTYATIYSSTNGGTTLTFYNGSAIVSGTIATSTWQHIAVTRYGSTARMFVNGIQTGSATHSSAVNFSNPFIGSQTASGGYMNGYIDDLRITKGIARYTSNFTPPTTAFLTL